MTVKEYEVLLLHGDMDQAERNKVITKFKRQEVNIMVATDVAGKYKWCVLYEPNDSILYFICVQHEVWT